MNTDSEMVSGRVIKDCVPYISAAKKITLDKDINLVFILEIPSSRTEENIRKILEELFESYLDTLVWSKTIGGEYSKKHKKLLKRARVLGEENEE